MEYKINQVLNEYKDYMEWIKSEGIKGGISSKRTVETYYMYVKDFINFTGNIHFVPYDIKRYFDYKESKNKSELSPYTKNVIISSLLSFIKFMVSKGDEHFVYLNDRIRKCDFNEFFAMREVYSKYFTKSLSLEEIKKLLNIFNDKVEIYSGIVLLFWSGARPGELTEKLYLAIKGIKGYVDFNNKKFKIENEKWRVPEKINVDKHMSYFRVIPWSDEINEYVREWCNYLLEAKNKWNEKNFRRILDKALYSRRRTINNLLNIEGNIRITPKTARYTVETELRKVLPQHLVNYWLGHKTLFVFQNDNYNKQSNVFALYTDVEVIGEYLRDILINERKHFLLNII